MPEIRIGLLGDVMLGRGVAAELRRRREPQDLWATEVRELCRSCDLVICNLECCVSERGAPTERLRGKPFFFRAPPAAIRALQAIECRAVSLANNHALDFEVEALEDTLDLLAEADIAIAGAGRNEGEARRAAVVEAAGAQVALVAVSDHPAEFAATPDAPGIAYCDLSSGEPAWLIDELSRVRSTCDLVIAFPHWGPNMASAPAPWQLRSAAALQRGGADLVAGHSAHVFHGVAWTEAGPLLYDLGDALDDYAIDPVLRNDLGALAVWMPGEGGGELELTGLRLDYCYTRLAEGADAEWIAARVERACAHLGTAVERHGAARFRLHPAG